MEELKWVGFGIEDEGLYEAIKFKGEERGKRLRREKADDDEERSMGENGKIGRAHV